MSEPLNSFEAACLNEFIEDHWTKFEDFMDRRADESAAEKISEKLQQIVDRITK